MIAGLAIAELAFHLLDPKAQWQAHVKDGDRVGEGRTPLATVSGDARALLTAERVALNFLQRLSGIATVTARYVSLAAGTGARIVDTRKTTPGLRALEKYAVRAGGGFNHRLGLYDCRFNQRQSYSGGGRHHACRAGSQSPYPAHDEN